MENPHYHPSDSENHKIRNKKFCRTAKGRKSCVQGGFCIIHEADLCRCGWEWKFHGGESTYKINPKKYLPFMRDYCYNCGTKIEKSFESYRIRGNYCPSCNALFEKRVKQRLKSYHYA